MNPYDVGDIAKLSYVLTDSAGTAYDPSRVVVRVYLPSGALDVTYTWLSAGGGDAALVQDSTGHWHVLYSVQVIGVHSYEFQSYSGAETPSLSIEREQNGFEAK